MAEREDVVRITATWSDRKYQRGTGFLIRVGTRTVLLTALHVVQRILEQHEPEWASTIDAEGFGTLPPSEFDTEHDWVAFDVAPHEASKVLQPATVESRHAGQAVSTFGFSDSHPEGVGLRGHLVSTSTSVAEVRSLQAHLDEIAAGLDLHGVSGGPLLLDGSVVGLVKSFLVEQGYARGRVKVFAKAATLLRAGTVIRSDAGHRYVVASTRPLVPDGAIEVEVVAQQAGAALDLPTGTRMTIVSPPFGAIPRVQVVAPGIVSGKGTPVGGVVFASPIARILEQLGAEAPTAMTPSDRAAARLLTLASPRPTPADAIELPSYWLTAAERKVEFDVDAREAELARLDALCEGSHDVIALLGKGGAGKTRLLLHWAGELRKRGWLAGFLERHNDVEPLLHGLRPRLVVIDYVERDPGPARGLLTAMRSEIEGEPRPRIKLVLLARDRGQWFDDLRKWLTNDDLVRVEPAYPDPITRQAAFGRAIVDLGGDPAAHPSPDLSAREYERPLYIQMRALLSLCGEREADDPLASVLMRERGIWHDTAEAQQRRPCPDTCRDALERCMTATTLCGGLTSLAEGRRAFERSGVAGDRIDLGWDCLRALYSMHEGLAALEPDLLAEQLVDENLARWADELDTWLGLPFALGKHGAAAVDLLSRTATRRASEQARRWLVRMLMGVMGDGGELRCEAMVRAIAHDPSTVEPSSALLLDAVRAARDVEMAMRISYAIGGQTIALTEVGEAAEWLVVEVARSRGEGEKAKKMLATALNNLGNRLSELGRREEALRASEEAVAVYRELAKTRPDAFLPDLAGALNNLGNRLSGLGRREEALRPCEEAVPIYRELVKTRPDAFLPDLATALYNLGNRLSELGRREEALRACEEAVAVYRELVKTRPDAFLPDLAGALSNLGAYLSGLGRREEALCASEEAVAIRRELVKTRPDAFLPDLAMALGVRGQILREHGDPAGAIDAFAEGLRRVLPMLESHPQAFLRLAAHLGVELDQTCTAHARPLPEDLTDFVSAILAMLANAQNH